MAVGAGTPLEAAVGVAMSLGVAVDVAATLGVAVGVPMTPGVAVGTELGVDEQATDTATNTRKSACMSFMASPRDMRFLILL